MRALGIAVAAGLILVAGRALASRMNDRRATTAAEEAANRAALAAKLRASAAAAQPKLRPITAEEMDAANRAIDEVKAEEAAARDTAAEPPLSPEAAAAMARANGLDAKAPEPEAEKPAKRKPNQGPSDTPKPQ